MATRMTAKEFVGREIRRAREALGISQEKLANPLSVSRQLVEAWESGRQGILPDHMKRLLGIRPDGTHGQPLLEFPPEAWIRLVEALVNGVPTPEWDAAWEAAEAATRCLYTFDAYLITGILQCPEYMEVVLNSPDSIQKRQARQQRFLNPDTGRILIALMSESVLHTNVGGPEVMASQMAFLADSAEHRNVMLHVVPRDANVCHKFRAPYMIAALDNGREIANVDDAIKGTVIEHTEDVETLRANFNEIRAEALRKSESVELIRRIQEQWTT